MSWAFWFHFLFFLIKPTALFVILCTYDSFSYFQNEPVLEEA